MDFLRISNYLLTDAVILLTQLITLQAGPMMLRLSYV